MKITPISADMLVKLGLGVLVIGVGWYAFKQAGAALNSAGSALKDTAQMAADAVNPNNQNNVAYQAANAVTNAATGGAETTLGGYVYGATNPDPTLYQSGWNWTANKPITSDITTGFGLF